MAITDTDFIVLRDAGLYEGYNKGLRIYEQTHPIHDWTLPITRFHWKDGKRSTTVEGLWSDELIQFKIKNNLQFKKIIYAIDHSGDIVQIKTSVSLFKSIEETLIDATVNKLRFTGQTEQKSNQMGAWASPIMQSIVMSNEDITTAINKNTVLDNFIDNIISLSKSTPSSEHDIDHIPEPTVAPQAPVQSVNQETGEIIQTPAINYSQTNIQPPWDNQAPVAQAPIAQAPVAQAPVAQAPIAQAPVAQAPVAQAPIAQAPVAQAPVAISQDAKMQELMNMTINAQA